jgi:hypothetical protein
VVPGLGDPLAGSLRTGAGAETRWLAFSSRHLMTMKPPATHDGRGKLDPSFGPGGTVTAGAPSGGDAGAFAVAVQPQRGIVTAGYAGRSDFLLARFRR